MARPHATREMSQASAYDRAASTGRTGAENTDDRRGPRLRRAAASTGRGRSGESPIGMSMAAATSSPSCKRRTTGPRSVTSSTREVTRARPRSRCGHRGPIIQPARPQPSSPATSGVCACTAVATCALPGLVRTRPAGRDDVAAGARWAPERPSAPPGPRRRRPTSRRSKDASRSRKPRPPPNTPTRTPRTKRARRSVGPPGSRQCPPGAGGRGR